MRVYPSGKKAFVVSYRCEKRKYISVLGCCSSMTTRQARQQASRYLSAQRGKASSPMQLLLQRDAHSMTRARIKSKSGDNKSETSVVDLEQQVRFKEKELQDLRAKWKSYTNAHEGGFHLY